MKTYLFRALLMLPMLLFFGLLTAQSVDTTGLADKPFFDEPVTVEKMLNWYNLLYGALVIVWGYVAKAFKLKKGKIPFVFVVVAGAAVIAGVFIAVGFSQALPLLFGFLGAIGIYDIFLKPAQRLVAPQTSSELATPPNLRE